MSGWTAKRFWTAASVVEVPGGYTVHLDARPVRTPGKAPLILPTPALAQVVAAEWEAQTGVVRPDTMPFTRLANSATDKVAVQHAEVADLLAAYGESDLLCYRANGPQELVARQSLAWDPLLDWAATELGAPLAIGVGVIHVPQPVASVQGLRARVHALDSFRLTAFHDLVAISGSLVIGFAVMLGRLGAEDGWRVSRIDEDWQIEKWGRDEEAEHLSARKHRAFLDAARVFDLLAE